MPEIITPNDEDHWRSLRTKDVTSTEVSALFNASPYMTLYELWFRKKNANVLKFEENTRMKWGKRLEQSIAKGIAEDRQWTIAPMKEYYRDPNRRMGSSFDFMILNGDKKEILEIKNVDGLVFKNQWTRDGDHVEAPVHIEFQVQHQLAVSGLDFAYIGALVGGNEVVLLERARNEKVISAIYAAVEGFWDSIENGTAPNPDFKRDAEFISRMYSFANPETSIDLSEDAHLTNQAQKYNQLGSKIKELESERESIKAEFLTRIGDKEKAIGSKWSISAGVVGPAKVAYERGPYRNFKLT